MIADKAFESKSVRFSSSTSFAEQTDMCRKAEISVLVFLRGSLEPTIQFERSGADSHGAELGWSSLSSFVLVWRAELMAQTAASYLEISMKAMGII